MALGFFAVGQFAGEVSHGEVSYGEKSAHARNNHIKICQTKFSIYLKKMEVNKKNYIFTSEKMWNSSNYMYDYAHSFFGKDF